MSTPAARIREAQKALYWVADVLLTMHAAGQITAEELVERLKVDHRRAAAAVDAALTEETEAQGRGRDR